MKGMRPRFVTRRSSRGPHSHRSNPHEIHRLIPDDERRALNGERPSSRLRTGAGPQPEPVLLGAPVLSQQLHPVASADRRGGLEVTRVSRGGIDPHDIVGAVEALSQRVADVGSPRSRAPRRARRPAPNVVTAPDRATRTRTLHSPSRRANRPGVPRRPSSPRRRSPPAVRRHCGWPTRDTAPAWWGRCRRPTPPHPVAGERGQPRRSPRPIRC